MTKLHHIASAVALLGCAASGAALAQSGDYYSGPDGYNPSWYVAPSINLIDPDSRFGTSKRGEGVGLRFGKPVSPSWDVQTGVTFSRAHDGPATYRRNTLAVDGLYMFSRQQLRPFVLIGVGAEYDKVNNPRLQAQRTSSYVNAGLGAQYSFNDQWGMQLDVRRAQSYLRGNTYGFERARTTALTFGLTYAFEKPAAARPVAQAAPVFVPAPPPAPMAAPMAAPPAPTPAPAPRFERTTLSATELFAFDSAALSLPQPKLDDIANLLASNAQVTQISITGYTDRLGSDAYNQALSQRRADAVKAYLSNKGVADSRMSAVGKGESNPLVTCSNKKRVDLIACLEPNRRVEVEQFVIERRLP
jgi:OmpA-OmpF porin, OOP family